MRACYSTGTSSALAGQRTRPPLDLHHAALLSSPILPQLDAWISCAPSPGSVSATRSPPSYIPCATGLPDKPRTHRSLRSTRSRLVVAVDEGGIEGGSGCWRKATSARTARRRRGLALAPRRALRASPLALAWSRSGRMQWSGGRCHT
jgi:hypothetical protein